jgi:glyoxylase-like metal-dependent hydrolase (beta-lactamase superfamily II)
MWTSLIQLTAPGGMMKSALMLIATVGALWAQHNEVLLGEETARVSEHVWAILGNPNIGIVVGERGVLVVDTGFGPRNGATITRVVTRLAPNRPKVYLTTTHFHPDHASGDAGFPPDTILIRNRLQQEDVERYTLKWIADFSARNAQQREMLKDATLRVPDIVFDDDARLDLGGTIARLAWYGGGHTRGDEVIFIEPDRTLMAGDLVQNNVMPAIFEDGGTPAGWVAAVEQIEKLNALHVLPDHSAPGDGTLVADERKLIGGLRDRALELKRKGASADEAAKQIATEFKGNAGGFVRAVYAER